MLRCVVFIKKVFLLLSFLCVYSFASFDEDTLGVSNTKQMFNGEDLLILQALDSQQHGEYKVAAVLYKELYKRSERAEYLKNSIILFLLTDYDKGDVTELIQIGLKNYPKDFDYERFHITMLLKESDIVSAKDTALLLLQKERSEQNIRVVGAIYLYLQDFNMALKYLEEAYTLSKNEQVMLQIVDVNLKLERIDDAISHLESYSRINGCTLSICYKLIDIYNGQKNIDGLLGVYKRLYAVYLEDEYAQKILEILMFQNKSVEAITFLEKSGYKPDILIEIYISQKQFDKAMALVEKMYKESMNLEYLLKMAIVEYESANKRTKELVISVLDKFEKSINNSTDPLYLNYYGYLLIDHDLDIEKGIELVRKALLVYPDSPYYQDSLAWGLYKQKKCEDAHNIMLEVVKKLDDQEILEHSKMIEACINNTNKSNQK